jgi:putative sterol carrier protein
VKKKTNFGKEARMAVLYPSNEWCQEWKKAINSSEVIENAGKEWGVGFNGNWLFEITPGGGLDKTTYLYLEAKAGKCTDSRLINDPSEVDAGFFCTGPYDSFKPVVKGEGDFIEGVVRGVFKLKGDMTKIMLNARFIRAVADSLGAFESEFLGE